MIKLEDINNSKIKAEKYRENFSEEFNKNTVFYTLDKKEKIEILPGEKWMQCYDESSNARRVIPMNYFLLEEHDLLALNPSGKGGIHLIRKVDNHGYWVYGISDGNGKTRTIYLHQLVAIIYGCDCFGNAKQILDEQGLDAFGRCPGKLQIHHKDGNKRNNNPSNLRVLTCEIHKLIEKMLPKNILNSEKRAEYFEKVCKELEAKGISEPVLLITGQKYDKNTCEYLGDNKIRDIDTVEKITFSKEGLESYLSMMKRLNWSCDLETVVKKL